MKFKLISVLNFSDVLTGKGRDLDMSDDESYNDNASVISNISCSTSNEDRSCKYLFVVFR